MLSCIQKDAPAIAILFLISALPQPSLVTLEPMYVELSTPSMSLFPTFRLVSLLILTFSTLQFLALGFKPILAELSSYFVVLCWRWFIEVDNRAMTSAKSYAWSSIEFWFVFLCMLHHPVSYLKEQESWQVIHIFEKKNCECWWKYRFINIQFVNNVLRLLTQ